MAVDIGFVMLMKIRAFEHKTCDLPITELDIFQITTPQHQDGFPVSVEETAGGPKVDWGSFVEFHDNALGKFINI